MKIIKLAKKEPKAKWIAYGPKTDNFKSLLLQIKKNPQWSFSDYQKWLKKNQIKTYLMDRSTFSLVKKLAQFILYGEANRKKIDLSKIDPKELRMGIKVEYEHTKDRETAKRIALDHLAELPDYYTRLKAMEEQALKELKKKKKK